MIKSSFTLPRPLKKFKVWAGAYGGHYDILILFKKKPIYFEECDYTPSKKCVDLLCEQNRGNILADISPSQFEEYFPGITIPVNYLEIEPKDLFQMELMMPVDIDGEIDIINFHNDWSR